MPRYTVRWSSDTSPYARHDKIETSEFFVADDPDPRGDWRVSYRWNHFGGTGNYWVVARRKHKSEIVNRPPDSPDIDPEPIADWLLSCRRFYRGEWTTFEISVQNCRESELDKSPSVNIDRFYWGDLEILDAVRTSEWQKPMQIELQSMIWWGEPRLAQLSRLAMQIERSTAMLMGRQPRRFIGMGEWSNG